MKYMLSLVLLNLVVEQFANAQSAYIPFPEDSAQWSVRDVWIDTLGNYITRTFQYKMRGDSTINGIHYNTIYKSDDLSFISPSDSLWCFVRQDTSSKQVFLRYPFSHSSDTTESLLYDFSLNDNDTLNFKLFSDGNFYNAIVINSYDSVITNTGDRRSLDMVNIGTVLGGSCDFFNIVEGIGNTNHPFYVEMPFYYCGNHTVTVQCFWHNGIYITGGSFCDFNTGENEITKNDIQVNQTPNALLIETFDKKIESFSIIDSLGNILLYQNNINKNHSINIELFSPGIYCLIIKHDDKFISKKFTKLN